MAWHADERLFLLNANLSGEEQQNLVKAGNLFIMITYQVCGRFRIIKVACPEKTIDLLNFKHMEDRTCSKLSHSWIRLHGGKVQVQTNGVGKGQHENVDQHHG